MKQDDLEKLAVPYSNDDEIESGRRFAVSVGASVASAGDLVSEIIADLDTTNFGISWWGLVPLQERILISDYLYQCVFDIETNLVEAKLHYLELKAIRDKQDQRIADSVTFTGSMPKFKPPKAHRPLDELADKLEGLHLTGFFRAIGSSLDCLGAAIVGVLGLQIKNLRRCYLNSTEKYLDKICAANTASQMERDFFVLYKQAKTNSGPTDWMLWAMQYRNALVHRGRLVTQHHLMPDERKSVGRKGKQDKVITRQLVHLRKQPDKSEAESWIESKYTTLSDDANATLIGVFKNTREFHETICNALVGIWKTRRANPSLVVQPAIQWSDVASRNSFPGYKSGVSIGFDEVTVGPIFMRRLRAAAVLDTDRQMWDKSRWK
jgi:hypothetical protein